MIPRARIGKNKINFVKKKKVEEKSRYLIDCFLALHNNLMLKGRKIWDLPDGSIG